MSASSSSWSITSWFRGSATSRDHRDVPRACVCLPTYNERENLEPMVRALLERLGPDDRVLVIDDNSPDGTGELADRLAAEEPRVAVLHRPAKEGLGPAYLAGFRRALDDGAELVLEMDCDFSHDPDDVPRLIAAADRRRPRARLPLRGRRAHRELGRLAAIRLARRVALRPGAPPGAGARPDRGIQVLPPRSARAHRPRRGHGPRLRVPDRDDLPRAPRRVPCRRGADHVRRPRGRQLEDEPLDRARGDLARAGCSGSDVYAERGGRRHGRELRRGRARRRAARWSSTSGRPGAARARRSAACSRSSRRSIPASAS